MRLPTGGASACGGRLAGWEARLVRGPKPLQFSRSIVSSHSMLCSLPAGRPLLLGRRLLPAIMRIAHPGAPYLDSRVVAARLNGRVCPSVQPGWVSAQRFPASTGAGAVSGCGSPSRQRPARFLAASAAAGASKEVAAEPQASQKRPAAGAAAAEQRADAVTASDSPPLAGEDTQCPELNWKAGAALAGASFEAYCSAEERGIPERHACGAEVYYVDKQVLHPPTVPRSCSLQPPQAAAAQAGECAWSSSLPILPSARSLQPRTFL